MSYCAECGEELDISNGFVSISTWKQGPRKNREVLFHQECFEQIASDEYTSELPEDKVCTNCFMREANPSLGYCDQCPPPGERCATIGCAEPRTNGYLCVGCAHKATQLPRSVV